MKTEAALATISTGKIIAVMFYTRERALKAFRAVYADDAYLFLLASLTIRHSSGGELRFLHSNQEIRGLKFDEVFVDEAEIVPDGVLASLFSCVKNNS